MLYMQRVKQIIINMNKILITIILLGVTIPAYALPVTMQDAMKAQARMRAEQAHLNINYDVPFNKKKVQKVKTIIKEVPVEVIREVMVEVIKEVEVIRYVEVCPVKDSRYVRLLKYLRIN